MFTDVFTVKQRQIDKKIVDILKIMCYYVEDKAMKRRVIAEIGFREPRLLGRGTEGCNEDGLGAAYRGLFALGYDGNAHYSVRVSRNLYSLRLIS